MDQKVLTIAGSDCSGGAGVQADLKTFMAHKVYGMSVITAITAQNTTGVTGIMDISQEMIKQQIDAVCTDIFPDAVKIGMVSVKETIELIAEALKHYAPKIIVLDPVMVATSGHRLLTEEAVDTLKQTLLPLATLITPNIPEAEVLCGYRIESEDDMRRACETIATFTSAAILIKGGHREDNANDYLYKEGVFTCFAGERVDTHNTHGTGCTLSAAIAAQLAKGNDMVTSIALAKQYITGALKADMNLGQGNGPLNHCYAI